MPSKKLSKARLTQITEEKSEELDSIIANLEMRLSETVRATKKDLQLLKSVSQGLYEELDKLSKKAPAEAVTDLVLEQLNDVITHTKRLAAEDSYVQKLKTFVAAGDNPENRDAVVVLKQILQGLSRFEKEIDSVGNNFKKLLDEARFIDFALVHYFNQEEIINKAQFRGWGGSYTYPRWLEVDYPYIFNFNLLNDTDLSDYFALSEEEPSET